MWTAYIKNGAQLKSAELSDYHVKISPRGDAAVASYLLRVKTLEANKKMTDELFQETDVWFKAAGGWKVAQVHYSNAPTPIAPARHEASHDIGHRARVAAHPHATGSRIGP